MLNKIKCVNYKDSKAFIANRTVYPFDDSSDWSRECARLAAEAGSPPTPDYVTEEKCPGGLDAQFLYNGKTYIFPRGDARRRKVELEYVIFLHNKQAEKPAAVIEQPGIDYII